MKRSINEAADPVTTYAELVLRGDIIAGKLVKAACTRHIDDLVEGPKRGLIWRPDVATLHLDFLSFFKHSKGEFAGTYFEPGLWQKFRIGSVYGWLRKENGARRFRTSYNEVARKNGKSFEAAAIGIDALMFDGEQGAEVYAAATKKDQARLVFDEARRMVRSSPAISAKLRVFKNAIAMESTTSAFLPLSSDSRTLDGLNPSAALIDELHKHINRELLDVIDTGTGARRQPLIWIITTAGDDRTATVYADERDYAEKVVLRILEDDSYFAYIATLDEGDRWDDEKVWIKANPNLGISIKIDDIQRLCVKAKGNPSAQTAFKRLRCNLRTSSLAGGIDADIWKENTTGEYIGYDPPAEMEGREAYAAFDLSSKIDLTACALLFPPIEDGERWKLFVKLFCPAENIAEREDRDRAHYQRWVDEHWIEATPGNVVDQDTIKEQILAWHASYRILACPYDTWDATKLSLELAAKDVPVQEFIQGLRSYSHPSKEFLNLIQARKLDHGGNPVLTWMASNIRFEEDKNLNKMPTKKKSTGRIDGLTATIMAYGAALKPDESGPYTAERGLIIL